jgi:hypothetical protein
MARQGVDDDRRAGDDKAVPAAGPGMLPVACEGVTSRGPRPGSRWDQASAAFVTQVIACIQREETQRDRRLIAPSLASARYADTARLLRRHGRGSALFA